MSVDCRLVRFGLIRQAGIASGTGRLRWLEQASLRGLGKDSRMGLGQVCQNNGVCLIGLEGHRSGSSKGLGRTVDLGGVRFGEVRQGWSGRIRPATKGPGEGQAALGRGGLSEEPEMGWHVGREWIVLTERDAEGVARLVGRARTVPAWLVRMGRPDLQRLG